MKKAFTLIELLVIVLIIGILTSVALPQYRFAVAKSRVMGKMIEIDALTKAIDLYVLANGYQDVSKDNLLKSLDIKINRKARDFHSLFCNNNRFGQYCEIHFGFIMPSVEESHWGSVILRLTKRPQGWTKTCTYYDDFDKKICAALVPLGYDMEQY